ncbi:peptidyl-prolyl cis-trans isomerase FKBP4 [Galendromus occidentalis]|uniref:peptidylprolyl isomerase n=1 Tax=Galendromus occidentalis TaxID=34638 RepID=A0AAJ7WHL1_9ACAR|nr:peptidyl-prolyl cis-trans isomerase FKBP4 [Galendromus occidentalis]XP_028967409.1 peptidyl-prolyl cis-trans isomerase FKBP4 [Galendromus occidentalis]
MATPVDLTEEKDGGVLKEVLREGEGDSSPCEGSTVYVYYHGTLEDGTVFDSSKDRGEEFKFQLGVGQVIKAWDIGVASMKKGELCRLTCKSEYAYGEKGSPPKIPPNATLFFEVELLRWSFEDISPDKDESIQKRIITKGEMYSNPKDLSECTLHLRGHHNGQVFDERDVTFLVGEAVLKDVPEGVEIAVQTMKKGEKAEIILKGKYASGPKIPADLKEVSYTVTLHNFEKARESWEMDLDEKLETGEKDKARGTEHFKAGRFNQALKYYERVHEFMKNETPTDEEKLAKRNALHLSALLNMSLTHLKMDEHLKCIANCEEIIAMDGKNVKAIFRRGQAKLSIKEYDDAVEDFTKCVELEPDNKAAQSQLRIAKAKRRAQLEKEKHLYKNMFAKLSEAGADDKEEKPEEGVWTNKESSGDSKPESA